MANLNYKINGKEITVTGTYKGLLREIEARKNSMNKSSNANQIQKYTTNKDHNHTEFAGGKWEDVTNLKNLEEFKEQLAEFRKHNLEQKVIAKLDFSPKRRRNMSEHDGDYDHDKQWEIKPFNSSRKELLPISVVDVNVDMSISAGMGADAINKYGALVWAVIQLVESIGIQCNINVINETNNTSSNGHGCTIIYNIKKSGEYISPVALATTFQSVFFRRAMFSGMVLACDEFKQEASWSLGSPKHSRSSENIWFKNGAIYTRPGGTFDINQVEKCITDMVRRK